MLTRQHIFYGVVGVCTVSMEVCMFALLLHMGVEKTLAAVLSCMFPAAFNYAGHCLLTFRKQPSWPSVVRYLMVAAFNTALHGALFVAGSVWLTLEEMPAKLLAIVFTALCNFFAQKHFTFGFGSVARGEERL